MNKLFYILVAVAMMSISSCVACVDSNKNNTDMQKDNSTKVLVAYFSASGVTEGVAKQIAEVTGGDLYKITPEKPYTDADLDWRDSTSRSSVEMKDLSSRPAIVGKVDNIAQYDTVYVGFPIWWYTAPTIINTFIEANDFTGKTIVPFATSGGSNIKKACEDLQTAYPNYKFGEGKLLNSIDKADIEAWAAAVK